MQDADTVARSRVVLVGGGSPAIFIYVDKPVRIKANVEHVIKQHRQDTSEGVN